MGDKYIKTPSDMSVLHLQDSSLSQDYEFDILIKHVISIIIESNCSALKKELLWETILRRIESEKDSEKNRLPSHVAQNKD